MPVGHRDYDYFGLSTLSKSQAYTTALSLADLICVHSKYLASVLSNRGYRTWVIPEGWSNQNTLLVEPTASQHALNLGWIGTIGQIEDVSPFRRIIVRVLREFPQVGFVVGGDPDVYRLFDSIPENRRLFLPNVNYEYFPYLFSQIDVLLNPMRKIAYNFSLSDRLLMEAGVRCVPWIASPFPASIAWSAGGIIANTPEDWHSYLRWLLLDQNIREKLGNMGHKKAEKREMNHLGDLWYQMIFDTWYRKQHP
jgi:glycosyltransferase involved in cell wall biosynthesis